MLSLPPLPRSRTVILAYLALLGLIGLLYCNLVFSDYQHFVLLARSFLHGHLYFTDIPGSGSGDMTLFRGHYYWPLGPFPAVLLLPFVAVTGTFHLPFYQGFLQFFLVIATFMLIVRLARREGFSSPDTYAWAAAFVAGTMYVGVAVAPFSWYFAEVVSVLLILLALYEHGGRRRWGLIGIILGCLLLTRLTTSLLVIYFLGEIWLGTSLGTRKRLQASLGLLVPLLLAGLLLMLYNYLRFASPFEQGYRSQQLIEALTTARSYGMESLAHLPGNLYYALLSPPLPIFREKVSHVLAFPYVASNAWGMGIFVTSPYLAQFFFLSYLRRSERLLIATGLLIAVPVLCYYGIGYSQYGYRYALDFLPLLYLAMVKAYANRSPQLSLGFRIAIILSVAWNLYLLSTYLAL